MQNRWQDPVYLIDTAIKDVGGHQMPVEIGRRLVFADAQGPARAEFYAAQTANKRLDLTLLVNTLDYRNETIVEHQGQPYEVIRAYPMAGDVTSLSLQRRSER